MKNKAFTILLAITLLLFGCNDAKKTNQETVDSIPSNTSTTASNNQDGTLTTQDNPINEVTSTENEQITVTYSLDAEYESAILESKSNAEKTSINEAYAKKWYDLIEVYYTCALNPGDAPYDDEFLAERHIKKYKDIRIIHENWEIYAQQRIENEENRVENIYTTGSIVPMLLSQFEYDLYRLHAIEMYEMCREAYISCPQP